VIRKHAEPILGTNPAVNPVDVGAMPGEETLSYSYVDGEEIQASA
jgi:hypothetical protein